MQLIFISPTPDTIRKRSCMKVINNLMLVIFQQLLILTLLLQMVPFNSMHILAEVPEPSQCPVYTVTKYTSSSPIWLSSRIITRF